MRYDFHAYCYSGNRQLFQIILFVPLLHRLDQLALLLESTSMKKLKAIETARILNSFWAGKTGKSYCKDAYCIMTSFVHSFHPYVSLINQALIFLAGEYSQCLVSLFYSHYTATINIYFIMIVKGKKSCLFLL